MRAPTQPGKSCGPYDPAQEPEAHEDPAGHDYYASLDGCACTPDQTRHPWSHSLECGPFPCTPNGCYVRECLGDDQCAYGLCAMHAGYPEEYCTVSDPH
jgi:hypothetical protein